MKTELFLFAGKLHPLLVHLPVGILCIGVIFYFLSRLQQFRFLNQSIFLILVIGFFSSLFSTITGYLLSRQGSYNSDLVETHQYAGIFTTLFTGLLALQFRKHKEHSYLKIRFGTAVQVIFLFVLVLFTGHQGGILTHGDDYLSVSRIKKSTERPDSAEDAILFEQIVLPILEKKCTSCHGRTKQKGGLTLLTVAQILKGGESGPAVIPGNPNESELIKRISLDPKHEDFMPAEGKTPLTKSEAVILRWWITEGEPMQGKKLSEYPKQQEIKHAINEYLGYRNAKEQTPGTETGYVSTETNKIKLGSIEVLRKTGVMVRILQHNPLMLDVTIPPGSNPDIKTFSINIESIKSDIIWLKLSENNLKDTELGFLASLTNLQKVRLEKNPISDGIAEHLKDLKNLEAVNLNETKITKAGLDKLRKNSGIKRIYYWHTAAEIEKP